MAKWMTLKSKRKACVGKGKQAKCRVINVKRKVRINPDEYPDEWGRTSQKWVTNNLEMIARAMLDYSKQLNKIGDLLSEEDGNKLKRLFNDLTKVNGTLGSMILKYPEY